MSSQVAQTILDQIKAIDFWALGAWGAKNAVAGDNRLQLDVKGLKFRGRVIITLTEKDDYTIEFGKIRNKNKIPTWTVHHTAESVYCDQLVSVIDHIVEGK